MASVSPHSDQRAWWHVLGPLVLVLAQTLYLMVFEIPGFFPVSQSFPSKWSQVPLVEESEVCFPHRFALVLQNPSSGRPSPLFNLPPPTLHGLQTINLCWDIPQGEQG